MMVVFPLTKNKRPAVPEGTNWQDYRGEANTPLIGVMIPQGLAIFDIDTYKGVSTDNVDFALGCNLDWSAAELQRTLNGGTHYAFRVGVTMPNCTNAAGVRGFDIRAAGKGYIATGEGYENLTFADDIIEALQDAEQWPVLPESVVELLLTPDESADDDGLMAAVAETRLDVTEDEAKAYIAELPDHCAEEQETWLRVGMGIYHQFGDAGWTMFDEFSQRCPDKYDSRANRKRWESFAKAKRANPVTFATVIELAGGRNVISEFKAKEIENSVEQLDTLDGIKDELKRIAAAKMDNLALDVVIKKIQAKYEQLTGSKPGATAIKREIKKLRGDSNSGDFVEEYVFLTATSEYMQRDTKAVCGPRAFDVKHSRETPLNSDGEKQNATSYANDRILCVENSMYFPAADEVFNHNGLEYINTYRAPEIKRVKVGTTDIVKRIKAHIAHLLKDEAEQQIVINYLAHNVQKPGVKMNWAIVLQGVQGDGKSLLAEMMQHVMGFDNVRIMNVQSLESQFTGWATGQCMTFIEELKLDNLRKYEVLNNLKPYISNPCVEEHKKGKDPRTVINTTNYFALTNFKDAIPVDSNDRRYTILFSQWQRAEDLREFMASNADYYPKLYEAMRENVAEIRTWLLEHVIPTEFLNLKRAPETEAKQLMVELSKSSGQVCLEEALEEFTEQISLGNGEIDITQLQKLVKNASDFDDKYDDFPNKAALKNALLNCGFESLGRMRTKYSNGDSKHTVYRK